jgi:hypothetical protein
MVEGAASAPRHESRDLSIRAIVTFALALTAFVSLAVFLLIGLFGRLREKAERADALPPPLRESRVWPPAPRLQVSSGLDLEELRRREEEQLRTYGWIDRDRRVVRIPIDRAMKLIAERGLPARPMQRTAD